MPVPLKYIAQQAQDDYTQDYVGNTSFFTLDDWVQRCGAVLGEYYLSEFKAKYAEYRQDKKEEVIAFSADVLSVQELEVKNDSSGYIYAELKEKPFSFTYDNQNTGYQNVFVTEPGPQFEAQRTSMNETWVLPLMGTVNTIWWYPQGNRLIFKKTGFCNVKKVNLYYVPSISEDMEVPDGIQNYVRTKAVNDMKVAASNQVVKESNDGNNNKTMETEVNKTQFKMP